MLSPKRKILAVVGAGPKGLAVAVKAKVLEEFGFPVDRVILIEKNGVGANWSGDFGYTNGEMKLGTSPEKDIVFPLETEVADSKLNKKIADRLMQFTWAAFLVQTKRYSDWVDRGRPAPCHQLWAAYLCWVSQQIEPEASLVKAEVVNIDISEDGMNWELTLKSETSTKLLAHRLMLTGPGETRIDFLKNEDRSLPEGTYDLESFWAALKTKTLLSTGSMAIVGAGENAASALLALSQYAPTLNIDLISPKGFIFSRGENFYENQVYSQPERQGWANLEFKDRINFIERTDLGVFSVHAMQILNDQRRHQIVPGRVVALFQENNSLAMRMEYAQKIFTRQYDQVVLATGFDYGAKLKSMFTPKAVVALEQAMGTRLSNQTIAQNIQADLSIKGMTPRLHLPMLAGLMQGPGFGNLSCLGRLSDRIIAQNSEELHAQ